MRSSSGPVLWWTNSFSLSAAEAYGGLLLSMHLCSIRTVIVVVVLIVVALRAVRGSVLPRDCSLLPLLLCVFFPQRNDTRISSSAPLSMWGIVCAAFCLCYIACGWYLRVGCGCGGSCGPSDLEASSLLCLPCELSSRSTLLA